MSDDAKLAELANIFATRLSRTVGEFTGTEHRFVATVINERVTIRHQEAVDGNAHAIPLLFEGETLLSLVVDYDCTWDSGQRHLSVEKSGVTVYPLARIEKEPLFRYEYVRQPTGHIPCSHLQVHAHRDSFTHLLGFGGPHSKRARRRQSRPRRRTPSVSEFHFPLGGPRFRPSLEDILDVLAEEFGLSTGACWESARDIERAEWRRTQVAAAVRDAPAEAVRVLEELGYTITGETQPDRMDKLQIL